MRSMPRGKAIAAILITVLMLPLPTLLPAQAVGSLPSTEERTILSAVFPLDGNLTGPFASPIDDASVGKHTFSITGGTIDLVGIGVALDPGSTTVSQMGPKRFHTLATSAAAVPYASLSGSHSWAILVVCREFLTALPTSPRPCNDIGMTGSLGWAAFSNISGVQLPRDATGVSQPVWNLTNGPDAGIPPWQLGISETNFPRGWATDLPLTGSSAGSYSVFVSAIQNVAPPDLVQDIPVVVTTKLAIVQNDAFGKPSNGIGSAIEPLWRQPTMATPTDSDATDDETPQWCSNAFPGAAAITAYEAAPSATRPTMPAAAWISSCGSLASHMVTTTWPELLADPAAASAFDTMTSLNDSSWWPRVVDSMLQSHIGFRLPELRTAIPAGCGASYPCVNLEVARGSMSPVVSGILVRDGGAWVAPTNLAQVYGGPTLLTISFGVPAWSLNGMRVGWPGASAGDPLTMNVLILPGATKVDARGVALERPRGSVSTGTIVAHAAPDRAGAAPLANITRPSLVPLISAPGTAGASPMIARWTGNTTSALQACVRDAYSHNDQGALPNFRSSVDSTSAPVATRLALGNGTDAQCVDLSSLVELAIPAASLGILAEIRLGDELSVDVELPYLTPPHALSAWSAGTFDPLATRAPVLGIRSPPAPWEPTGSAFDLDEMRSSSRLPRVIVTLPRTLSSGDLSDAALLIAYALSPIATGVVIEIDDLPLTQFGQTVMKEGDDLLASAGLPLFPIVVPAGVLPASAWTKPAEERLLSIQGLAASERTITIGAGNLAVGVHPWSRLGPTPLLGAKPDFLAESQSDTALAAANVVPLVEMAGLLGVRDYNAVRGLLAGVAIPFAGDASATGAQSAVDTFYLQGYGVLDVGAILADIMPQGLPDVSHLAPMARAALAVTPVITWDPITPHTIGAPSMAGGAIAGDGSGLLVLGGSAGPGGSGTEIFRLDPSTGLFTPKTPLTSGRVDSVASQHGGAIFLFGGIFPGQPASVPPILRYDPATGATSTGTASVAGSIRGMSVAWVGDKAYILSGGQLSRYDPATDRVDLLTSTMTPGRIVSDGKRLFRFSLDATPTYDAIDLRSFAATPIALPADLMATRLAVAFDGEHAVVVTSSLVGNAYMLRFDSLHLGDSDYAAGQRAPQAGGNNWQLAAADDRVYLEGYPTPLVVASPGGMRASTARVTDGPLLDEVNAAIAAGNAGAIAGISLPPGILDTILWAAPKPAIDTPILPGTLIADWGTTDTFHPKEATIKVLDVEAALQASWNATRANVRNIVNASNGTLPAELIPFDAHDVPDITFGGPDNITIETRHYDLFSLLSSDLVFGFQDALLEKLATDPAVPSVPAIDDPTRYLIDTVSAILPGPYGLTENKTMTVEATPGFAPPPACIELTAYRKYLVAMSGAVQDEAQALLGALDLGITGKLETPDVHWITKKAAGTNTVLLLQDEVCDITDLENYINYGVILRQDVQEMGSIEAKLGDTEGWLYRHSLPAPASTLRDRLNATAMALGIGPVTNTTAATTNATQIMTGEIDTVLKLLVDIADRWVHVAMSQPRLMVPTVAENTSVAPVGPYVGLTLLTTHDTLHLNPLTGGPLCLPDPSHPPAHLPPVSTLAIAAPPVHVCLRDITVPIPALLFNDPEIYMHVMYRDATVIPDEGLNLRGGGNWLRSFRIDPTIRVGDLDVPLLPPPSVAPPPPPSPLDGTKIGDAIASIDARIDTLDATLAKGWDETAVREKHALELTRDALLQLATRTAAGVVGNVLGDLVSNLYSRPLVLGDATNDDGEVRFGTLFPGTYSRWYPYGYGTGHTLDQDLPQRVFPAEGGTLSDVDASISSLIRDAVVGPDGSQRPDEPPRWSHLPDPLAPAITRSDPLWDPSTPIELHGDATRAYHQFDVTLQAGLDLPGLLCQLVKDLHGQVGDDLRLPFVCPEDGQLVRLPDVSDTVALLCASTTYSLDPATCASALQAALTTKADGLVACAKILTTPGDCESLVQAYDLLRTIIASLQTDLNSKLPMPLVQSLTRTLQEDPSAFQLDQASLVARIEQANHLDDSVAAQRQHAIDTARTVLDDLERYIKLAIHVDRPDRTAYDDHLIAAAIESHATDKVDGAEWLAVRLPPDLIDSSLVNDTLALIANATPLLNDSADRAWATSALATLRSTPMPTLVASIRPPTRAEINATQPRPIEGGSPFDSASAGDVTSRDAWLPEERLDSVSPPPRPTDLTVSQSLAAIHQQVESLAGIDIGSTAGAGTLDLAQTPTAANALWTRNVQAAGLLRAERIAGASPLAALRALGTVAPAGNTTWSYDAAGDAIRAVAPSLSPVAGIMEYSIPLPPQERITLTLNGEYYMQNTDGFVIVTPDDGVRDLVLAGGGDLRGALAASSDVESRAAGIAGGDIIGTALGESDLFRVHHLNPAVQVEQGSAMTQKDDILTAGILTKYGGLRTKDAHERFEFDTKDVHGRKNGGYGLDELHVIYVFFPTVDSANVGDLAAWQAQLEPSTTLGSTQALVRDTLPKFVLRNVSVSWSTYLGFKPGAGSAALAFGSPWTPRIEDLKLYWSIPAATPADISITGPGGTIAGSELPTIDELLWAEHGLRTPGVLPDSWNLDCGDTYTPGRWYASSFLYQPRGIESGNGDREMWSGGTECLSNTIDSLLPDKIVLPANPVSPASYSEPPKTPLSWLQYDLNTQLMSLERFSGIQGGISPLDRETSLLSQLGLIGTAIPSVGIGSPADDVAGRVMTITGSSARFAKGAAIKTAGFAVARLNEILGAGALGDLLPEGSYDGTSRVSHGLGATASRWLVIDGRALERVSSNGGDINWTRPRLAIAEHEQAPFQRKPYIEQGYAAPFSLPEAPPRYSGTDTVNLGLARRPHLLVDHCGTVPAMFIPAGFGCNALTIVTFNAGTTNVTSAPLSAYENGVLVGRGWADGAEPGHWALGSVGYVPRTPGTHTLHIVLGPAGTTSGDETYLDNNEVDVTVVVSGGTAETHDQWAPTTARFAPARLVVAQLASMQWAQKRKSDDPHQQDTETWDVMSAFSIINGFDGSGISLLLAGHVTNDYQKEDTDPLFVPRMRAFVAIDRAQIGYSAGGVATAFTTSDPSGSFTRDRLTPPQACWAEPLADAVLEHAVCWLGGTASIQADASGMLGECGGGRQTLATTPGILDDARDKMGIATAPAPSIFDVLHTVPKHPEDLPTFAGGIAAQANVRALAVFGPLMGCLATAHEQHDIKGEVVLPDPKAPGCLTDIAITCDLAVIPDLDSTLPISTLDRYLPVKFGAAPGAPINVTATRGPGSGNVSLDWDPPAGDVTGYAIDRGTDRGSLREIARVQGAAATSFVDHGDIYTRYYYQIFPLRSDGSRGAGSTIVDNVTAGPPTKPLSVLAQNGGTATSPQLAVTWARPDDDGTSPITDYVITVCATLTCSSTTKTYTVDATTFRRVFSTTEEPRGNAYSVHVFADNAYGRSIASAEATFTLT